MRKDEKGELVQRIGLQTKGERGGSSWVRERRPDQTQ